MSVRKMAARTVAAVLIAVTAFTSVGLTAQADSLFVISIHPALVNLSVDVDIKIGTRHFHRCWSALPDSWQL